MLFFFFVPTSDSDDAGVYGIKKASWSNHGRKSQWRDSNGV